MMPSYKSEMNSLVSKLIDWYLVAGVLKVLYH